MVCHGIHTAIECTYTMYYMTNLLADCNHFWWFEDLSKPCLAIRAGSRQGDILCSRWSVELTFKNGAGEDAKNRCWCSYLCHSLQCADAKKLKASREADEDSVCEYSARGLFRTWAHVTLCELLLRWALRKGQESHNTENGLCRLNMQNLGGYVE